MNRITLAAAIGFGLLGLTGCQVRQIHQYTNPSAPTPASVGATPTCPAPLYWNTAVHGCDYSPSPAVNPNLTPTCPAPLTWNPAIHSCDGWPTSTDQITGSSSLAG